MPEHPPLTAIVYVRLACPLRQDAPNVGLERHPLPGADKRPGHSHISGSGAGTRTQNPLINSQMLCQLSYPGRNRPVTCGFTASAPLRTLAQRCHRGWRSALSRAGRCHAEGHGSHDRPSRAISSLAGSAPCCASWLVVVNGHENPRGGGQENRALAATRSARAHPRGTTPLPVVAC
jgi:hypothetical protein